MRRRNFIAGLASITVARPLAARAQQPALSPHKHAIQVARWPSARIYPRWPKADITARSTNVRFRE
jgi:hypothetical protein